MITRRNSRAFRRSSWLAVLAILLQALLPSVHDTAMAYAAGQSGGAAVLADLSHHLCLASGNQAPDAPKAPVHPNQPCTLCVAVHAITSFTPAAVPVVLEAPNCAPIIHAATGETLSCRSIALGPQPRGPPALI
jgi:hypothetical protein